VIVRSKEKKKTMRDRESGPMNPRGPTAAGPAEGPVWLAQPITPQALGAESNSAVARWGASWRAIPEPLRNDGAIGPTHVTDSQVLICFLFLFSVFPFILHNSKCYLLFFSFFLLLSDIFILMHMY